MVFNLYTCPKPFKYWAHLIIVGNQFRFHSMFCELDSWSPMERVAINRYQSPKIRMWWVLQSHTLNFFLKTITKSTNFIFLRISSKKQLWNFPLREDSTRCLFSPSFSSLCHSACFLLYSQAQGPSLHPSSPCFPLTPFSFLFALWHLNKAHISASHLLLLSSWSSTACACWWGCPRVSLAPGSHGYCLHSRYFSSFSVQSSGVWWMCVHRYVFVCDILTFNADSECLFFRR